MIEMLFLTETADGKLVCYIPLWFPKKLQRIFTHGSNDYKMRKLKIRKKKMRKAK